LGLELGPCPSVRDCLSRGVKYVDPFFVVVRTWNVKDCFCVFSSKTKLFLAFIAAEERRTQLSSSAADTKKWKVMNHCGGAERAKWSNVDAQILHKSFFYRRNFFTETNECSCAEERL
jgi:hypothetical protein